MKVVTVIVASILATAAFAVQTAPAAVPGRGRGEAKVAATPGEVTSLEQAFTLLRGADHDYDGHRVKAMRAIAEACRMLGSPIVQPGERGRGAAFRPAGAASRPAGATSRPGGKEPEDQSTSDSQLKQALTIVQQVRGGIASGTQAAVAARLDEAISEINTALSVK